jgi:hypothetical protein
MSRASFDILFCGELVGDAAPDEVRRKLQQRFKLSDEKTARLFSGHTVSIKRGVDTATASAYRQIFRDAGALVQIQPSTEPLEAQLPKNPQSTPAWTTEETPSDESPAGDWSQPAFPEAPHIDISHLSLVPGTDWTLEDCQPPHPPVRLPDISHLELVILEADDADRPD